jgi:phosphatidylglycerophosphate synthase
MALIGYLAGVWLTWAALRRGFDHPTLGLCNVVTLARLALTAGLLAALGVPPPLGAVFGVAAVALVLDGVDGWLARREGRVSAFGARFDMEVDSALALVLALTALSAGTVGAAVLLIALPRYVFVIAGKGLPWLNAPLPERFSRKVVCVVQVGALVALQLPLGAAGVVVAVVAGALAWSFGRDVVWLWRARA